MSLEIKYMSFEDEHGMGMKHKKTTAKSRALKVDKKLSKKEFYKKEFKKNAEEREFDKMKHI
jgi:hypothetical protein